MNRKTYALLLAALFAAPCFTIFQNAQAQETIRMKVEPAFVQCSHIHEIFNVTVQIYNIKATYRIVGVQFRLQYNDTLLKVINISEGAFMKNPSWNLYGTWFISDDRHDDPIFGTHVIVGILLLPNETTGQWTLFPEGDGTLTTITFQTIYRPVEPLPPASCSLNLADTMIIDEDLNEIPHTVEGAVYEVKTKPIPKLTLQPQKYEATLLGEMFNLTVNLNDADSDWRIVGVQFRLQYNHALLKALNVSEGPFLSQFNNTSEPPYTYFISRIEDDPIFGPNVLVGILILPNATGCWTNFPEGAGTLATITFQAIRQPDGGQAPISSNLILNDTMLINDDLEEIPHELAHGLYDIQPLTFSYQPVAPSAGEVVLFKVAEPKTHAALLYTWDFGDGSFQNTTEPVISHIYATPGRYNVSLTCTLDAETTFAWKIVDVGFYMPLDISIDVGSIHLNGELAQFHILVTHFGKPVDVTGMNATLYYNGLPYIDLSTKIQRVNKGLYIVPFTIPGDAKPGTYTLMVTAVYFQVRGACIKSFVISSKLSGFISDMTRGIATIQTTLGTIEGKVIAIEGNVATIQTDLGKVTADVSNVLKAASDMSENQGTLISLVIAATLIALLAAVTSAIILIKIRRKA